MLKFVKGALQVAFLCGLAAVGDLLARLLHTEIPGSILGLLLLFALLMLKVVKIEWVDSGASWLLATLLLFFVPSTVGIVQFGSLIASDGVRLFLVTIAGTLVVMCCTGLVAEGVQRLRGGRKDEHVARNR